LIGSLTLVAAALLWAGPAYADAGKLSAHAAKRSFATTFVGRVKSSNAYIAVLKDGRKVGGYVCNDGPGGEWIEYTWLRGGKATLRSGQGKVVGHVTVNRSRATGTVEVAGQRRRFSATRTRTEKPGLYFAIGLQQDSLLVGGWILLPDGTQRGAVSGVSTSTLQPLTTTRAPRLSLKHPSVQLPGGGSGSPPPVVEPEPLVVINIIAVLIALLVPAVQS
jgi:hypothetical protein